ncbi:MAG TPA: trehalose-phosphatase [Candidatus Binatia bacterium]|nr:trehalose-phosphatase [Candidatus Binatia bacterium]
MTAETGREIENTLAAVRRAPQSLLMLDYDGTLAPFRNRRPEAFPYPGITRLLEEIVRCGRTRLAIISGRDVRDVASFLGPELPVEIWGLHGLQRVTADCKLEQLPVDEAASQALNKAKDWLCSHDLKEVAEFKTGSIAVHWRGLRTEESEWLRGRVLLGWRPIVRNTSLQLLNFDGGLEIRTPIANKGDAVRKMLSEMPPASPAAYLGDDNTDEQAFQAINESGLSILVRPCWRDTLARAWITPPDELKTFLTQWLEATKQKTSDANQRLGATV